MFHLMHGYLSRHGDRIYLDNALFGLEVFYKGIQTEGTFFLFPQWDQTNQTFKYFAFDAIEQKNRFEQLLKIQGIGGKSSYLLAMLPSEEVKQAIERMDLAYFQKFQGIWPKTAKRLLVELKQHFSEHDLKKLTLDQTLQDDIIHALKPLGYMVADIKKLFPKQPYPFDRDHLAEIMKRLITHL